MAKVDVSPQIRSLLSDATVFGLLPPELRKPTWWETSTNLLDGVAEAALNHPRLTSGIFAHFEPVFSDIAARWVLNPDNGPRTERVISAFAGILPFCPYISVLLEDYLRGKSLAVVGEAQPLKLIIVQPNFDQNGSLGHPYEPDILQLLLSTWRLMSFNKRAFSGFAPAHLERLFDHPDGPVRYLAIRIFCQQFSATDLTLECLIREHINSEGPLEGVFDGENVDYTFLTLLEHTRARNLHQTRLALAKKLRDKPDSSSFPTQTLTSAVVSWGGTLIPRPSGSIPKPSSLVLTNTTISNLEDLAKCLRKPGPILLTGLPGSGKTSLVQEAARELRMDSKLVTLHLNEQTDAKVLIGLYTSDTKPGSFQWRPGILTTTVKEGRWVLIEDLDRAPTEVMSTLLPLIERGELLIPSRGDTIRAPSSFRIFATVRTTLGLDGQENIPSFLGQRFWQVLPVQQLPRQEIQQVIYETFPLMRRLAPAILAVFDGLSNMLHGHSSAAIGRGVLDRSINTRDLFKWCRRLESTLISAGSKSSDDPISDTTLDFMFMEAVDCFLGSVRDQSVRELLARKIGHEMHMSGERVAHIIHAHIPRFEDGQTRFVAGRAILHKTSRPSRIVKPKRPFASTVHAKRLLEQVSVAVQLREPVLLVGETGIGKTTVVQQLADSLGHKLVAVNLSQQSEASDLLGGFKPVNPRSLATPLKEEFEDLFAATGISAERNQKYLSQISKCIAKGKWADVSKLWSEAPKMFHQILSTLQERQRKKDADDAEEGSKPAKRRKTGSSKLDTLMGLLPRWERFSKNLEQFDIQISGGSGVFAFAFSEGNIVKAVRNGDWVLLDEINLAPPDTLESIADLLQLGPDGSPSILLSETGQIERISAHPDFRIFAAMNPATDVGKRDLPLGLRSRFTELYVGSPDKDVKDLIVIIKTYLRGNSSTIDKAADRVANLYLAIKKLAEERSLVDGADEVPHFSLRTLTRVLTYVNDVSATYGLYRSLFEGFCMGFLTLLDRKSENLVLPIILDRLTEASPKPPKRPEDGRQYVKFLSKDRDRQYWLLQGAEKPKERTDYIRTRYVERNLLNLVRATSTRRFPVLIQGPTSAGKTSMIEYLANYSGNKFVRINNHEHTDLQEYLGTYVSGNDGNLRFQEGVLVQAMRQGSWIVLDELNLAPTDVLEALNRLLDDNRELLIPETQEVVRPHENFMLFATQNPPGLYGGRKVLSRAFRNRFLELHFDDIPEDELEEILQRRCRNASPPDCRRIVAVYKELSRLRQTSRVFEQKDSFATLRDLFRWALRDADDRAQVAQNGYMLLAERVRNEEERMAVKGVIETVFKVPIGSVVLYNSLFKAEMKRLGLGLEKRNAQDVIWTGAMRRLFVLVSQALRQNEPVLLVGETGCGKTTICQVLAEVLGKELHIVNAHQNTETGDLLGSQRPVRNRGAIVDALRQDLVQALRLLGQPSDGAVEELHARYRGLAPQDLSAIVPEDLRQRILSNETRSKALFEWSDGSLVQAMKTGDIFLLDEISLADDSVLERLNSVLEPQRTLLLAEKGIDDHPIEAADGFQFLATMNPGGDFGKKELSPALRNRFTEIWVPPLADKGDVLDIVSAKLDAEFASLAGPIVEFSYWFGTQFRSSSATAFSIRDILVWAAFANKCSGRPLAFAFVHGAATVFIDTLGASPSALTSVDPESMSQQRRVCLEKLGELIGAEAGATATAASIYNAKPTLRIEATALFIGDFSIPRSAPADPAEVGGAGFAFEAPTTKLNAMRVVRALQINKPILLEGNPGVGKTTLVAAIAQACGQPLTRINLSDQTDLMDLFGTDVPVEGAEAGSFAWRDAPFLQAMQKGEWVLLDEMNLASQSVLEGLNACLDHRGEVYVAELDRVFKRHRDFRLFAAQNPHLQGGGRKGLPSSFVNRFVVVYADVFTAEDQMVIASKRAGDAVSRETVAQIIEMISALEDSVVSRRLFGSHGAPWEFNLRDTLRWIELLKHKGQREKGGDDDGDSQETAASFSLRKVEDFLDLVVRQRFRTETDRQEVVKLFRLAFKRDLEGHSLYCNTSSRFSHVGGGFVQRSMVTFSRATAPPPPINLASRLAEIESLLICVRQNLPCILAGPSGSGKSSLLQHVASVAGKDLVVFHLNADVDTMDLVGGFEQADPVRELRSALADVRACLQSFIFGGRDLAQPAAAQQPLNLNSAALDLIRLLDDERNNNLAALDSASPALSALSSAIQALASTGGVSGDSELGASLERAFTVLGRPLSLPNPRFEWFDGIIVKAAQAGQWLVLDNANLCSASVLDRLNSLLERPGGFLSINEHSGPDGEPRIVIPHPDFRVFLTMDPRYGELSRAMRNRSVEIYLDLPPPRTEVYLRHLAPVESSMLRFHDIAPTLSECSASKSPGNGGLKDAGDLAVLTADSLSLSDSALLLRFSNALDRGLLGSRAPQLPAAFLQHLRNLTSYVLAQGSPGLLASRLGSAIFNTYSSTWKPKHKPHEIGMGVEADGKSFLSSLVQMQPLHPLQDPTVVAVLESQAQVPGLPQWLGACYDIYLEVRTAEDAMKRQMHGVNIARPSALNRFQRSCISKQVAAVSKDSTAGVSAFLASVLEAVEQLVSASLGDMPPADWAEARNSLRSLLHYWWRTFRFVTGPVFEEASFQAHLLQGSKLLDRLDGDATTPDMVSAVRRGFHGAFEFGFKLTSGLGMEILWALFRPLPLPDEATFRQVVEMEHLASRFDSLRWRANATAAELETVTSSLVKVYSLVRSSAPHVEELLAAIRTEISDLESETGDTNGAVPLLSRQFEALRKMAVLGRIGSSLLEPVNENQEGGEEPSSRIWMVLSDLPTVSQMHFHSASGPAKLLQAVNYLFGQQSDIHPWSGSTSSSLLAKLDAVKSEPLSSLGALEAELPLVGRALATTTRAISRNPLESLNGILWKLVEEAVSTHVHPHFNATAELTRLYDALSESFAASSGAPSAVDGPHRELLLLSMQNAISSPQSASLSSFISSASPAVEAIIKDHLFLVIAALAASNKTEGRRQAAFSAVAWVQFAVGCIKLYVPDKIFDPHLRAKVEMDSHQEFVALLRRKLSALDEFDRLFADGSPGLRSKLLRDEVQAAVNDPPPSTTAQQQPIFRQSSQQHAQIQGEFTNILKVVVNGDVSAYIFRALTASSSSSSEEVVGGIQLIKDNVAQLIGRLANRSAAYQDMTVPAMNFLRCLQVGLSLADSCIPSPLPTTVEHSQLSMTASLPGVIPLLGGSLWRPELDTELQQSSMARQTEFLPLAMACASVEGTSSLSSEALQTTFECFHFQYQQWSKALASEQKAAESKGSLYRFRGSFEDEEEQDQAEFDELFPDYSETIVDSDIPKSHRKQNQKQGEMQRKTIQLAKFHGQVFLSPEAPESRLQKLCTMGALGIAQTAESDSSESGRPQSRDQNLLSATLLVLGDKLRELHRDTSAAKQYNFYTDPNLPEARKLVELVHRTQTRFRELQGIDEIGHLQPLDDVVTACTRVLEVGYAEPLAKMLPAVEKLHECLYEWQFRGYASRQYTPPGLYDKVTETIVSWRRLELSTWSRLFDTEMQKCADDGSSWWFLAYQAVIAGPLSLIEKGADAVDLRSHAVALLRELEEYFANSVVGEFAARLGLLRQLLEHVRLLAVEHPALAAIRDALFNFVAFYGRFERKAAEAIKKGRASLDKGMKDVLLMASWKDTNIAALRESSRRSHQKLFRLVRKFRAVLGQPMRPIITLQGIPDEDGLANGVSLATSIPSISSGIPSAPVDADAIKLCQEQEQRLGRQSRAIRLSRAEQFVAKMAKLGAIPGSAVPAADLVDSFLSDTASAISELRKETPPFLTDENKELVKHLKTRKVRLFNDTLKTVRTMGFSWNMSAARLANQNSASVVLARMKPLPLNALPPGDSSLVSAAAHAEYQLHRLVDVAPKWRNAMHDYHADLSRDALQRSVGYLESILFVALQQRDVLSDAVQDLRRLEESIASINPITTSGASLVITSQKHSSDLGRVLKWLIQVLKLARNVVVVHASLGKMDNKLVEQALQEWIDKISAQHTHYQSLPQLPPGITCSTAAGVENGVMHDLEALRDSMNSLAEPRPDLLFVLEQISLWTTVSTSTHDNLNPRAFNQVQPEPAASMLYDEVLLSCQKVLSAMQNFSQKTSTLPTSTEDASWLVDYSSGVSAALKSLHVDTVTGAVNQCFAALKLVAEKEDMVENKAALSIFATALPILKQYAMVGQQTLSQLAHLHSSTCRMGHQLAKSFLDVASHGFCTPQEKSDEKSGDQGKVEGGTGLGDGEGAENISKDIGPEEDLSELAQDPNNKEQHNEDQGDEEEDDAIDMGADELEGELASVDGKEDDGSKSEDADEGEDEDDVDEQAGDVDDLDPTAVDEKMWNDEDGEEADKDQRGDSSKGQEQKKNDEQVGADDAADAAGKEQQQQPDDNNAPEPGEQEMEEEEMGPEQDEAQPQEELNRQDQNVQESEALALPDEMDLDLGDGEDDGGSSDGGDDLDDLPELGDGRDETQEQKEDDDDEDGPDDQEGKVQEAMNEDNGPASDGNEADGEEVTVKDDQIDEDVKAEDDEDAMEEGEEESKQEPPSQPNADHNKADEKNAAPSEVQTGGGGLDQAEDAKEKDDGDAQDNSGQREHGDISQTGAEQDAAATSSKEGATSRRDAEDAPPQNDDQGQNPDAKEAPLPFKKLGDLLEKWYRNNKDIKEATAQDDKPRAEKERSREDAETAAERRQEFQHLQDENASADTQALGAATDEEAKPVDDSMAIDDEMEAGPNKPQLLPEDDDEEDEVMQDAAADGEAEAEEGADDGADDDADQDDDGKQADNEPDQGRSGVSTRKGAYYDRDSSSPEPDQPQRREENGSESNDDDEDQEDEQVQQTSTQLSSTHIGPPTAAAARDLDECARLWADFQAKTHGLSLSLASQLRLILTPSQSTKLSGAFRTGKRLNIKKIIPYIASGYKRDKIWMRRSVPTKRAYQILLCVDDSLSMGELDDSTTGTTTTASASASASASSGSNLSSTSSSPGALALESLVMLSRALAMLEAGQVGVLGFGSSVFAAHDLASDPPFATADAGARAMSRFGFSQDGTDVALLMRSVIDRFRAARALTSGGSSGSDLWQLALVMSDGLTPSASHEGIRRLLREAMEERIMVVFIIMDGEQQQSQQSQQQGGGGGGKKAGGKGGKMTMAVGKQQQQQQKRTSVLDLKEAKFVKDERGESSVVLERYLDSFPFPYYLIVHRLDDLPGALAGLLRTWFAEVNS